MTRPVPVRRYLGSGAGSVRSDRARAFEALVLTFALASVVEAALRARVEHRALVALLALGWTLPSSPRGRYPFWAPIVVCAALVALAFDRAGTLDRTT